MTKRIAVWACVGLLVTGVWGLYFSNADRGSPVGPLVYVLARVTQPIATVVVTYVHSPVGLTWVAVMNAATYGLAGLIVAKLARK